MCIVADFDRDTELFVELFHAEFIVCFLVMLIDFTCCSLILLFMLWILWYLWTNIGLITLGALDRCYTLQVIALIVICSKLRWSCDALRESEIWLRLSFILITLVLINSRRDSSILEHLLDGDLRLNIVLGHLDESI